ncbi:hypothetical protein [Oryzobacter telluris]|uniref:hypothetical protein n=1 Tax=Oryzobacter telluris TaxID=3149179 RepID=UPI00370D17A3
MTQLHLGTDAVARLTADVARYGSRGVETGALLLTPIDDVAVSVIALAGAAGIERHPGLLRFSTSVLSPLFSYAEENELQLRAQVHSHKFDAFLSPTDKAGNIRMVGFIACVIPNFATPSPDPSAWGWWTFGGQHWTPSASAVETDASTKVITFDAEGIHES